MMNKVRRLGRDLRRWLLSHLPASLLAEPFEWLIGYMCLVASPFAVLGVVGGGSVESLLHPMLYALWGVVLGIGAIGMISGLTSIRRTDGGYRVTRLPSYLLGLRLLSLGSVIYAIAIIQAVGFGESLLALIYLLPFAAACSIRLLSLEEETA